MAGRPPRLARLRPALDPTRTAPSATSRSRAGPGAAGSHHLRRIVDGGRGAGVRRRGDCFAFETTLSGLGHARRIPRWRDAGYRVRLVFLRLPTPEVAVARVARRVAQGGHGVPESAIRRRFVRGWRNFEHVYRDLVDDGSCTTTPPARRCCWPTGAGRDRAGSDARRAARRSGLYRRRGGAAPSRRARPPGGRRGRRRGGRVPRRGNRPGATWPGVGLRAGARACRT